MTNLKQYRLTPLDTALFRDARPFDAEDSAGARLVSLSPPQLGVLGAFRSLLIGEAGSTFERFAAGGVSPALGDGPEKPGTLSLGPVLPILNSGSGWNTVFPPPADLVFFREEKRDSGIGFNVPERTSSARTNLPPGLTGLQPAFWSSHDRLKMLVPGDDYEVTPETRGLLDASLGDYLLCSAEPKSFVSQDDWFWREAKIGLKREADLHTAQTGFLYTAECIRPRTELPSYKCGYSVSVLEGGDQMPERRVVIALGGERRPFELWRDASIQEPGIHIRPQIEAALRERVKEGRLEFRLYLLSSVYGPDQSAGWRVYCPHIDDVELDIFAAAVPRSRWLSGWSAGPDGKQARPLAAQPHVPAGSVYFLQAVSKLDADDLVNRILNEFWYRPALCPPPENLPSVETVLQQRAGHGMTFVGVVPNAH